MNLFQESPDYAMLWLEFLKPLYTYSVQGLKWLKNVPDTQKSRFLCFRRYQVI